MNDTVKGVLASIGSFIALLAVTALVTFLVSSNSSDGWAGLGALIMMMFATGIVFIVLLIVGIVLFYKKKSRFGLGLIYGVLAIFFFIVVSLLFTSL